ncbi:MarR family winged helix-turn-helix transcriptional regulator [Nocardia mangyaensis]|uniref:MarR family winged helix-turn-helix transcriptional regulator n=1 Tax=Nocardia mangyaensis TaxID=2213200 RepID=UPI000B006558|nr:MarR family winged helix-turn-helix transcriptional regulator [Nocardia mangyaensis]
MTDPQWLDDVEMRAWLGYVRTRDLIAAAIGRDAGRTANLSWVEYSVLVYLADAPGQRLTFADLASALEWSQSRLSHQITRMQKRGLVTRETMPHDARRTVARLTTAGGQLLTTAAPAHVRSVRRHMIDVLDRDQLAALAEIYEVLINHHRSAATDCGAAGEDETDAIPADLTDEDLTDPPPDSDGAPLAEVAAEQ